MNDIISMHIPKDENYSLSYIQFFLLKKEEGREKITGKRDERRSGTFLNMPLGRSKLSEVVKIEKGGIRELKIVEYKLLGELYRCEHLYGLE